jgi:hypothetical protein
MSNERIDDNQSSNVPIIRQGFSRMYHAVCDHREYLVYVILDESKISIDFCVIFVCLFPLCSDVVSSSDEEN